MNRRTTLVSTVLGLLTGVRPYTAGPADFAAYPLQRRVAARLLGARLPPTSAAGGSVAQTAHDATPKATDVFGRLDHPRAGNHLNSPADLRRYIEDLGMTIKVLERSARFNRTVDRTLQYTVRLSR